MIFNMEEKCWFFLPDNGKDVFVDNEYFEQMMVQPNPFIKGSIGLKFEPGINLFLFDRDSTEILEEQNEKESKRWLD